MRGGRRDVAKEQFWRESIAKRTGSGLSIRAFCQQHDLSEQCFYAWRRELALRDAEDRAASAVNSAAVVNSVNNVSPRSARSTRAAVTLRSAGTAAPRFVPVVVNDAVHTSPVGRPDVCMLDAFLLDLANGRRLTIPITMPMESVAQLIRALELPAQEGQR